MGRTYGSGPFLSLRSKHYFLYLSQEGSVFLRNKRRFLCLSAQRQRYFYKKRGIPVKKKFKKVEPYIWILPSVLLMAIFILVPIIFVFRMALSDVSKAGLIKGFAGLENFRKVTNSPVFAMVLKNTLIDYWREIHNREDYVEISTPIMLNRQLWETSGHWDHYKENMYTTVIDDQDFAIKPMNCPGGVLVYESEPRSYRDLPLRMGELGLVHRHEKSGQLHGLMRVRCFTQDDAHIFMTPDQIREEIKGVAKLIDEVYSLFGFKYHVELSTRPEDSMGSDEDWEMATDALRAALDDLGLDYAVNEGDGAFYGPKIDFHLEDSLGRTWQCGTIQLDFQLPQRFNLEYIAADGEKHRPIMIHRVVFGSIERFIGILIEHFAGAFPTWLAPVQVRVLPISDKYMEYGQKVLAELKEAGIRAEIDTKAEKIGYKIREARLQKIPYMLVVGAKEEEDGVVSVRSRFKGDEGQKGLDAFISDIKEEIKNRENRKVEVEEQK